MIAGCVAAIARSCDVTALHRLGEGDGRRGRGTAGVTSGGAGFSADGAGVAGGLAPPSDGRFIVSTFRSFRVDRRRLGRQPLAEAVAAIRSARPRGTPHHKTIVATGNRPAGFLRPAEMIRPVSHMHVSIRMRKPVPIERQALPVLRCERRRSPCRCESDSSHQTNSDIEAKFHNFCCARR